MRRTRGKLICVWSPVLHGEGCSTLACSAGFGMHHYSGKEVLVLSKSNSPDRLEKYLENDMEIKYSIDNLRIFGPGIRADHIMTYATLVNTGLYMIGGMKFDRELARREDDFDRLFLEKCLESFDLVIADLDTGIRGENRQYLDAADIILAVTTPNDILLDEIYNNSSMQDVLAYFSHNKTINVINKLYDGWNTGSMTGRYRSRYGMRKVFGFNYDGDILNSCCMDRNFYSFLIKEIKRGKGGYTKQLKELCIFLAGELHMEENAGKSSSYGGFFKSILRSSTN